MATEQTENRKPPPARKISKRKFWLSVIIFSFLLLGAGYGLYRFFFGQFYETTDNAYVVGNSVQIMSQISGHVTQILAEETGLVVKGDPIIYLDQADATITLERAKAQLATTIRQTKQLYNNVDQYKANVALKQATLEKLQGDLQRREELADQKVISVETLKHIQSDVKEAQADVDSAKEQLAAATSIVANSDLYHHPNVQQAMVAVRDAYLNLQRTTIYTPETGYVARRAVQVGQEVTPNTVLMLIIPINQIWVNANFKETQLAHIRIGQKVRLTADAYGSDIVYDGTVVGLSPGTGSAFDILPPQNATGNWIKIVQRLPVRIKIDSKQLQKYPLRIGLTMTVSVDTHDRSGKVLSQVPERKVIYQTENYSDQLKDADKMIDKIFKENSGSSK